CYHVALSITAQQECLRARDSNRIGKRAWLVSFLCWCGLARTHIHRRHFRNGIGHTLTICCWQTAHNHLICHTAAYRAMIDHSHLFPYLADNLQIGLWCPHKWTTASEKIPPLGIILFASKRRDWQLLHLLLNACRLLEFIFRARLFPEKAHRFDPLNNLLLICFGR